MLLSSLIYSPLIMARTKFSHLAMMSPPNMISKYLSISSTKLTARYLLVETDKFRLGLVNCYNKDKLFDAFYIVVLVNIFEYQL